MTLDIEALIRHALTVEDLHYRCVAGEPDMLPRLWELCQRLRRRAGMDFAGVAHDAASAIDAGHDQAGAVALAVADIRHEIEGCIRGGA